MPTKGSLDRLAEAVRACRACPLGTTGQGVPGMWSEGALNASQGELKHHPECKPPYYGGGTKECISRCQAELLVMILGEAPGGVEMARGKPFVGQSGELLHSLLKEVGLTSYYVSNIAKHQPPKVKGKQQAPDSVAVEACAPFLRAELDLVRPDRLLLLGKTAAKLVCEGNFSMGSVVNQTFKLKDSFCAIHAGIPTLVLYHPSYFLRSRTAPWVQKQVNEWKRAVRLFLGDKAPTYRIERVRCEAHD